MTYQRRWTDLMFLIGEIDRSRTLEPGDTETYTRRVHDPINGGRIQTHQALIKFWIQKA